MVIRLLKKEVGRFQRLRYFIKKYSIPETVLSRILYRVNTLLILIRDSETVYQFPSHLVMTFRMFPLLLTLLHFQQVSIIYSFVSKMQTASGVQLRNELFTNKILHSVQSMPLTSFRQ